ncbi:uncharacterized protein K452DRAFT_291754 [Aplosporella prunicola CBS 121167]|uniref:Uncharacterized protein n=1 Tax=Aplosporella prunicola CBS 121167 TaxID=1176127 RepID=A0A6A6B013_9PEZI|nr:uncharacterized protein K452DRAFT_291754 [Aplosporella prunicola CBS 121167]KAF2137216.1 hypothetical protein K452DRAFT_291754 [Aplosporella prunicola CBS 121167]
MTTREQSKERSICQTQATNKQKQSQQARWQTAKQMVNQPTGQRQTVSNPPDKHNAYPRSPPSSIPQQPPPACIAHLPATRQTAQAGVSNARRRGFVQLKWPLCYLPTAVDCLLVGDRVFFFLSEREMEEM